MEACGLSNPILGSTVAEQPNDEMEDLKILLEAWHLQFGEAEQGIKTIRALAFKEELFPWLGDLLESREAQTRFGLMLSRHASRNFGGYKICRGAERKRRSYSCRKI